MVERISECRCESTMLGNVRELSTGRQGDAIRTHLSGVVAAEPRQGGSVAEVGNVGWLRWR